MTNHVDNRIMELTDDQFGPWLAGFMDGEACFFISKKADKYQFACHMSLRLRDDDTPLLAAIQKRLGIGRVYHVAPQRSGYHQNDKPQTAWHLFTCADCKALISILGRYPLLSKKARDYTIWTEGVQLWQQVKKGGYLGDTNRLVYDQMARVRQELIDVRKYSKPERLPEREKRVCLTDAIEEIVNAFGEATTDEVCQEVAKRNLPFPRSSVATSLVRVYQQGRIERQSQGIYVPVKTKG